MREFVAVLDFGSQYAQLISRRIRECGVYCEILPHDITRAELKALTPKAVVLSGGPASVLDKDHPGIDAGIFDLGIPVLGICYGLQLMADALAASLREAWPGSTGLRQSRWIKSRRLFEGSRHVSMSG